MDKKRKKRNRVAGRYRIRVRGDQIPPDEMDLNRLANALLAAAREKLAQQKAENDEGETAA